MNWLPQFSVERPISTLMLFLAIVVLGLVSWSQIALEFLPGSFSGNSLYVYVPYADAQPRETEEKLTLPIEDALSDIQGLSLMKSRSRSGATSLNLSFHRSADMDGVYNDIVDRMERLLPSLPEEVHEYYIYKWDASDTPIMWVGVGMEGTPEEQYELLYNVVNKKLSRIPGVGQVDAWGPDPKAIFIDFSRDALMRHGVSQYQILQDLRAESFQLPSGRLNENGTLRYLRSFAKLDGMESFEDFPIKNNLTLSDVASINYRLSLSADLSRINGKDGAGLSIRKESDANTIETTTAIKEAFEELKGKHPLEFFPFFDQGEIISSSLNNLKNAALTGGLFAIIILYLFLRNTPMTLIIAGCIPFTLLFSVGLMYMNGGTLNILSLMGLMLSVGMVVDNAIVIVESIYARRVNGEESHSAAILGSNEVGLAITLSTLTTVAVFLPLIVMNQDSSYSFFLQEIGFPIVISLVASLLAALLFTPLSTTFLKPQSLKIPRWISWTGTQYKNILSHIVHNRRDSILGLLLLLTITYLLPMQSVGCADQGGGRMGDFEINFEVPPQYGYYQRVDVIKRMEAFIEENRENWGVRFYVCRLRATQNNGDCDVTFEEETPIPQEKILEHAQNNIPTITGVRTSIGWDGSGDRNTSFSLQLHGENTSTLETIADRVIPMIEKIHGVVSVESELEDDDRPEIQLLLDREALTRYGLSARNVAWTVASALRSNALQKQVIDDNEVDVVARFRYQDRSDIDVLLNFPVISPTTLNTVPLGHLVTLKNAPTLGSIRRTNRKTSFPLTINISPDVDKREIRTKTNSMLALAQFPDGYGFTPPFDVDELTDHSAMLLSLIMSIALVFLIMGALFESFLLPLAIITTIPMAILGAYWSLYLSGSGMDNIAVIGIVILIGVVVNNGIVLIELVNRLRIEGVSRIEAIIEAGERRFRPIMMTTLTTVFGLVPMAFGTPSPGSISYTSLGKVVVGGMTAGTFLTLFFVPLLYLALDDMRKGAANWLGWMTKKDSV